MHTPPADLRHALIVGYAEIIRRRVAADAVWLQETQPLRGRTLWHYCTREIPPPATSRRHRVLGCSLITLPNLERVLSVLWYRNGSTRDFDIEAGRACSDAVHHLRWLMDTDLRPHRPNETGDQPTPLPVVAVLDRLSPTEQRIYELLRKQLTEAQIAKKLNRSYHTVHVHVKNIYRKLDIHSRREILHQCTED